MQLEIATHPILVKHLQVPVLDALQIALESHRYALRLDQDNADIIFNTAQVLTSIAEEIAKEDGRSDAEAVPILEEALALQNRCLSVQELKLEESATPQDVSEIKPAATEESDDEDGGASLTSANASQEEQWFSIVEPITSDTLIDTILAQLGTLTTLCGILSNTPGAAPPATLGWIEEYSTKLLKDKLPTHAKNNPERTSEISIVKANFISSLLEAGFRSSNLDAETYKRELDAAYAVPELATLTSPDALTSRVRALIAFNAALADSIANNQPAYVSARWNALTNAMAISTTLSKQQGLTSEDKAKSHRFRGDVSLLQYQMGHEPVSYQPAITNKAQLLKNAEVFYRNANKLSPDDEEQAITGLRSAIATLLQNGDRSGVVAAARAQGEIWLSSQIEDMVVEGLIPNNLVLS